MIKRIRKAVFPVAGLGTRFLPATKAMPKEMLTVVDKPLIQYAVEEAVSAGIEEIIFVTGKGKTALEDHFDRSYELEHTLEQRSKHDLLEIIQKTLPPHVRVTYTRQGDALGLGHAVLCAKSSVGDEPFAVLLADDIFLSAKPCLQQMVEQYNNVGNSILAIMEVPEKDVTKYGIIAPGQINGRMIEINNMVEKPDVLIAPSNLAICGRYILTPEIFNYLENQGTGEGGEIQLTDSIDKLIKIQKTHGYKFEGKRFDCGDKLGWLKANIMFALEKDNLTEQMGTFIQKVSNDLKKKS